MLQRKTQVQLGLPLHCILLSRELDGVPYRMQEALQRQTAVLRLQRSDGVHMAYVQQTYLLEALYNEALVCMINAPPPKKNKNGV